MDSKLGEFLSLAEKEPWFENTLIIITADTSSFQPPQSKPKDFGEFVPDKVTVEDLGKKNSLAIKLMKDAGWN